MSQLATGLPVWSILPFCSATERPVCSPGCHEPPVSAAVISPFRRGDQTWASTSIPRTGWSGRSPLRAVAPSHRIAAVFPLECWGSSADSPGLHVASRLAAGSWSQASVPLVLPSMSPLDSVSDLCGFSNSLRPDYWVLLQQHGILRQNHPSHRGSGRMSTFNSTSRNSIPSLWSQPSFLITPPQQTAGESVQSPPPSSVLTAYHNAASPETGPAQHPFTQQQKPHSE